MIIHSVLSGWDLYWLWFLCCCSPVSQSLNCSWSQSIINEELLNIYISFRLSLFFQLIIALIFLYQLTTHVFIYYIFAKVIFIIFPIFNLFSWSITDLQYCINFCCTAKWLFYKYIHYFSFGLSQNTEYSSLWYAVGPCDL